MIIFRILLLSAILTLFSDPVLFAQDLFPFVGESTSKRVHVRSGQNVNFESLMFLDKGQEVVIIDQKYDWYKVQLPQEARSFISTKFVQPLNSFDGVVIGSRVNVRARPSTSSSVLGQLVEGNKVRILQQVGEWYQISPPASFSGWVHQDFVRFKSNYVPNFNPTVETVEVPKVNEAQRALSQLIEIEKFVIEEEAVEASPEDAVDVQEMARILEEPVTPDESLDSSNSILVDAQILTGYVQRLNNASVYDDVQHKLVVNDDTYYLEGFSGIFKSFLHAMVEVEGHVKHDNIGRSILVVSRINLVL